MLKSSIVFLFSFVAILVALFAVSGCMTPQCSGEECAFGIDGGLGSEEPTPTVVPEVIRDCQAEAEAAAVACGAAGLQAFSCEPISYTCVTTAVTGVDCSAQFTVAAESCGAAGLVSFTCDNAGADFTCNTGVSGVTPTPTPTDEDPACSDGIDNDSDGAADFPADSGCSSATDDTETTTVSGCTVTAGGQEYCDEIDNDCDGSVDNADWDGDGYVSKDCSKYDGKDTVVVGTGDCADWSNTGLVGWLPVELIHPGAVEMFDWIDADCDGFKDDATHDNCIVQCDSNGDGVEEFERDGDSAYECVDASFLADRSSTDSPIDPFSWVYDTGTSTVTYTGVAVTCEATTAVQKDPSKWASDSNVIDALCARTPALTSAECKALF